MCGRTSRVPRAFHAIPQKTFDSASADAGPIDLLVVPGGPGQEDLMGDEAPLEIIAARAAAAACVFSVCTGALICGAAGIDGTLRVAALLRGEDDSMRHPVRPRDAVRLRTLGQGPEGEGRQVSGDLRSPYREASGDAEAGGGRLTRWYYSTCPQSLMVTLADVFPLEDPTASIFLTTS
jgi:putative intracellular protease/amidase